MKTIEASENKLDQVLDLLDFYGGRFKCLKKIRFLIGREVIKIEEELRIEDSVICLPPRIIFGKLQGVK